MLHALVLHSLVLPLVLHSLVLPPVLHSLVLPLVLHSLVLPLALHSLVLLVLQWSLPWLPWLAALFGGNFDRPPWRVLCKTNMGQRVRAGEHEEKVFKN